MRLPPRGSACGCTPSQQLAKENIPGDDRVNTFDELAAYARSNAIVSLIVLVTVIQN
jgi:hypothetical protein